MEAVGTLASGIAHDFNNLLMAIQGRTSLIAVDLDADHPHTEHASAIEEYIRSAVNLTNQLLGFVRGGKYEVRPVDLNAVLETSATLFGRTRKQIRIWRKTAPEPMVVEADKGQIEQVLLNIYVNAWHAMPEGGDLYLATCPVELDEATALAHQVLPGRYVKISLTDTGSGMTEEVCQKVFDPFFTTKAKGRGTGLGLASAYGIIRNHGGLITVASQVGQGSTFDIYLPASPRLLVPEAPREGQAVGGQETILLVDDETIILEAGKAMLERLGYRVLTAGGGAAAAAVIAESGEEIDLVILDLVMPEVDGGAAFERIRALRPSLLVLLSSGYSVNGQAMHIMQQGCSGFIQKPFTISELDSKVRAALEARKRPAGK
jgi:CheY-like chemotaxis protein